MKKIFLALFFAFALIFGADKALAQECKNWVSVANIGGSIKYEPAVMASPEGKLIIAAIGVDGAFWINEFHPRTLQNEWYSLGGILASGPNMVINADNKIAVTIIGADNAVWQRIYQSPKNWDEWQNLGSINFAGAGPIETEIGEIQ